MKRFITNVILLLLISTVLFLILKVANKKIFVSNLFEILSYSFVFTFFIFSITYNGLWRKEYGLKKIILSILITFSLSSYFIMKLESAYNLHKYLNSKVAIKGWRGKAHKADSLLGHVPIPNARAFHTFPIGEDIPMAYDGNGFRIPVSDTMSASNYVSLDFLFLGCSFTYGAACVAEHTYPHLVSEKTNLSYANAGVSSYGLAQMVLLAEKLIPQYKPKYVVLQHSPWLVDRSCTLYAPVFFGVLPNPYFIDKEASFAIHPPVFKSLKFSFSENANFIEALLFNIKNDLLRLKTDFNIFINKTPKPAKRKDLAELYAYNRIIETAKQEGSKIVIVKIYNRFKDFYLRNKIKNDNVYFVNADSVLFPSPIKNNDYYYKIYGHWCLSNGDSVLVDSHPNKLCHEIIADEITKILKE